LDVPRPMARAVRGFSVAAFLEARDAFEVRVGAGHGARRIRHLPGTARSEARAMCEFARQSRPSWAPRPRGRRFFEPCAAAATKKGVNGARTQSPHLREVNPYRGAVMIPSPDMPLSHFRIALAYTLAALNAAAEVDVDLSAEDRDALAQISEELEPQLE